VPEIIDPVFAKTSQYARFLLSENERFGLVFVKTGSINSGIAQVNTLHMNLKIKDYSAVRNDYVCFHTLLKNAEAESYASVAWSK
jgi:hypothetical protein